jgi:sugar lactone lactonase YvrE
LWAVDITSNRIVEYSTEGDELSSFDTPGVTWGQGLAYADGSLWLGNNCSGSGCTVSLREYDTDGNLLQQVGRRSSESTAAYGGLAATETELLGPDTDGNVSVLRTIE